MHLDIYTNLIINPNEDGKLFYHPGQTVTGVAELKVVKTKKFRSFYVAINGIAKCSWTLVERDSNFFRNDYVMNTYEGQQIFFDSKSFLFGHEGADSVEMTPGTYKYHFAVELPFPLPSSLEGNNGSISYEASTYLDVFWGVDLKRTCVFKVLRQDDLKLLPELKIPQRQEKIQSFCSLLCKSEFCNITVSLPHGGFAKGKTIPLKIEYENHSIKYKIKRTNIIFRSIFVYTSSTPSVKTKYEHSIISQNLIEGVNKQETKRISCEIEIPENLDNSNERFCQVFVVRYALELAFISDGWDTDTSLSFPIMIGTFGFDDENEAKIEPSAPIMDEAAPSFEEVTDQKSLDEQQEKIGVDI